MKILFAGRRLPAIEKENGRPHEMASKHIHRKELGKLVSRNLIFQILLARSA